jgi:pimeloyl-ACP methyl ester carboxylesterase/DNA-binding CsgD family transcriptional regulator
MEQQIRFCTSPHGARIAYAAIGEGPPFVKAANLLGHLEFDWKSPVWRHWLLELARYHTLIRYDEGGCGLSDWDVENFSLDVWVEDLETVVNALGLEQFPLLGLSQGGPIAITYAVRHPEKVSQLILYGSYARGRFKRNLSPEQVEEVETLLKLMEVGWGRDNPAFRQVFTTLLMPEATVEQMRWLNELQRLSASPENAVRFRNTFYSIDVSDLASQVSVPTLVLHARKDAAVPFEEGRRLAGLIPNARFVPLESNNHILLEREPAWQHFLLEVRRFLGTEVADESHLELTPMPLKLADELTDREREILELIAQGLSNAQIGERLVISPKTVSNHITSIFSKMQIANRAEAIVRAREAGFGKGRS